MAEIGLIKRVKYAGDVHAELLKVGWSLDAATAFVNNIPDADIAHVRHGKWIFGKDLPYSWGQIPKNKYHLYCSECLEQAFNRSEDNDPDFDVETPYCPACGCCVDGGVD